MFEAPDHPTLVGPVSTGEPWHIDDLPTSMPDRPDNAAIEKHMAALTEEIARLQEILYADARWSVLVIFQGRDAAGKDGAIRRVFQEVSPSGLAATAFGPPSREELAHDFFWRTTAHLPARGHVTVFNRSYYEEVLVARVRPELLTAQGLPDLPADGPDEEFWAHRLTSIRDHELHLARNGTVVLKFLLHISPDEQYQRFQDRLDEPDKHWKFDAGDIDARVEWAAFSEAYDAVLNETSTPWAPWYVIPADHKPHLRLQVAEVIAGALRTLRLRARHVPAEQVEAMRALLEATRKVKPAETE